MLALTLIPGDAWKAPVNDEAYHGFDRNLTVTSGSVDLTSESADLNASPDSMATANLATTLRRTLRTSIDATLVANAGPTQPFRIGAWSPWTGSGYFVAFDPAPSDTIKVETISGGSAAATLTGGSVVSRTIGRYELNTSYRVALFIDRAAGVIRATVLGPGVDAMASLAKADSPGLFENVQLSVTASSDAGSGGHVVLRNYVITLPHERVWTATTDDPLVRAATIVLALLGLIAVVVGGILGWRRDGGRKRASVSTRFLLLAIGCAIVFVVGNVALFRLGGHPFDFANEKLYAYVAKAYGPTHLYFVPDVTSLAGTWNGVPWIEASFPYEPVSAYLFTAIGWVSSALAAGAGTFGATSSQVGYVIKATNVAFGLADGTLIYLILRETRVSEQWSRIGAAFFVFSPAVWFSMSIWGQNHVFSIFFILLSILFALRHLPFWAWLALAAACLTRPQMVAFGLLLGIAFLRQFSWRQNVGAVSWTVIVTFLALVPLTLNTSPSLPVDILRYVFSVQEAGGNQASLTTVSQSAYSIWPLVTYVFHGASGVERAFTASSTPLLGTITYQKASQALTALLLLAVCIAILARKRSELQAGEYLPLVAVGVTGFFMLLTGVVATHFLLALPLLLLCRKWMDSIAYCFVAAIWTITTLVPMYGDMGDVISSAAYPLLAPANNPVTQFFVRLYVWDRFITVAIVANICVVIWLAVTAYRPWMPTTGDGGGRPHVGSATAGLSS